MNKLCSVLLVFVFTYNYKLFGHENLFPHLQMGEYHIVFKAGFKCNSSFNYQIDLNLHQSKMSSSKTVLKGNINFHIPYDDSLIMDLNFAILDKIGGWKDNALVFKFPNACSSSISLLEYPVWEMILKSINVTDFSCPIKEKNYVMHDLDMDSLVYTVRKSKMFPKTFFYGSYKAKYILKKKNSNTQVACFIIIVDVARPWEDTYHYQ